MTWLRANYGASCLIDRGYTRFYVDLVRSDGYLFRAGVDVPPQGAQPEQAEMLRAADYFLNVDHITAPNVGVEYGKGEEGWVEL
jgi:hypothetical protein